MRRLAGSGGKSTTGGASASWSEWSLTGRVDWPTEPGFPQLESRVSDQRPTVLGHYNLSTLRRGLQRIMYNKIPVLPQSVNKLVGTVTH